MFVFRVLCDDALEPLMHEIADLSRANEMVHRIQASVVPYSVPRFVDNNSANLLYTIVISLLSPPVVEKTKGVNEACWTSLILSPYSLFFACSCLRYKAAMLVL